MMHRTIAILLPSSMLDHHLYFFLKGMTSGSKERLNTHGRCMDTVALRVSHVGICTCCILHVVFQ